MTERFEPLEIATKLGCPECYDGRVFARKVINGFILYCPLCDKYEELLDLDGKKIEKELNFVKDYKNPGRPHD